MARRARKTHWPANAKRVGVAMAPLLIAAVIVAVSLAIRVTTAVELDLAARAVSFTVGADPDNRDRQFPLLDNSTVFSALTIEDCGAVSLPQMLIAEEGAMPALSSGAVTFRCDATVPGSKVTIRSESEQELGIVDRVLTRNREMVRLELTGTAPPGVRLQLASTAPLDFSLRRQVPFVIATEFAAVKGFDASTPASGIALYRGQLPEEGGSRRGQATVDGLLSVVVELAASEGMATLFRRNVDIPIEEISLFQHDPIEDVFVSTVIDGELRYASTEADSVPIEDGDRVRFRGTDGLRLTGLAADGKRAGLVLTLEGDAAELSTNGTDRRIRLFDRVVSDRTRGLAAMIAVIASQLVWLRQQWGPGRKA